MKILVTGGAGFIGSHLCKMLLTKGNFVVAVDIQALERIELTSYNLFHFYQLDVNDTDKLEQVFYNNKFDMVYHLASNTSVPMGQIDVNIDLENTFHTTLSVLKLLAKYKVNKFVYTSSSTVYGDFLDFCTEYDSHLLPISYYGAAKLAGEAFVSAYSSLFDIQTWVFRLCNVVGEYAKHGVIYDIFQQIDSGIDDLYLLGDGSQEKPFLYIDDLLDGMQYIISYANEKYNLYLIGNNTTITLRRMVEILCKETNRNINVFWNNKNPTWPGDVKKYRYCVKKAILLGWKCRYNSEEAVVKTIQNISKLQ